jgi:hypothetical protein
MIKQELKKEKRGKQLLPHKLEQSSDDEHLIRLSDKHDPSFQSHQIDHCWV